MWVWVEEEDDDEDEEEEKGRLAERGMNTLGTVSQVDK